MNDAEQGAAGPCLGSRAQGSAGGSSTNSTKTGDLSSMKRMIASTRIPLAIVSMLALLATSLFARPAARLNPSPTLRLAPGGIQPYADFDGDGYSDLAVGVPTEDAGSVLLPGPYDVGSVNVLRGAGSGLSAAGDQLWS